MFLINRKMQNDILQEFSAMNCDVICMSKFATLFAINKIKNKLISTKITI